MRRDNTKGTVEQTFTGLPEQGSSPVPELMQKAWSHHQAGRLQEADVIYQSVLQEQPNNLWALYLSGFVAYQSGKNEMAVDLIENAIKIKSDVPDFHNTCGEAYRALYKFERAIACYEQALIIKPDYPEAHNNMGIAHFKSGRYEEAIDNYEHALSIKPDFTEAYFNLGIVLNELRRHEDAIVHYEQALAIKPDYLDAYYNLAALYEKLNQVEKANYYMQKVFQLQPNETKSNRLAAVLLKREEKYNEALDKLKSIALVNCDTETACSVHFDMGKLYDLVGDGDSAIYHSIEGNRLQADSYESKRFDKDYYLNKVINIREQFTEEWVKSWPELTLNNEVEPVIFLIGFPRSGTTLLDQMLDSHPGIQVIEEKPMIDNIVKKLAGLPGGYPAALASLNKQDVDTLRKEYFANVEEYVDKQSDSIIIDKLPLHTINTGLIYRLFPESKIIQALRHPYDVCLSNFMQHYKINTAMANFFTLEDTAELYDRVMGLWRKYVELLPLNYIEVKYELLVDDFETETRRLLSFLDIDWDPVLLDYTNHAINRGAINTPSYSQVTKPIYQHARYRWQRYEKHLMLITNKLESHVNYFDYRA